MNEKPGSSSGLNVLAFIAVVLSAILGATTSHAAAVPAAKDTFEPAPAGAVQIKGQLGEKLELCTKSRLVAQSTDAVIKPYRDKTEIGSGDWRCEYWGKWFTSLALADGYKSTAATRSKLDEALNALIATAASDGYIGTRLPEHRLKGWDVWGRKYALLGVIAYYDRTGDQTALQAACRHLDTLLAQVGPGKTNIANVGEHKGLAASSILEPTVLLYQRTGDRKYLDFAKYIVEQWSKPSQSLPQGMRLIEDTISRIPPAKMSWNKAYEMMSCFEGLCELYRSTGNPVYLEACKGLGESIIRDEVTIVGPGTQIEHWFMGKQKQADVVNRPMETCVTATWMKFAYQLLRLTGETRYADELEKNLYNGLLGAMMPDGSWWAYFSAPMGERVPSDMQHEDVGLSCCVVNGPRGLMLTPFWAFMSSPEGPVINLYSPAQTRLLSPKGNAVEIAVSGDYPVSENVEIALRPEKPEEFTVALRIPEWSQKTSVRVNGKRFEAEPGTYLKVRRTWRPGDKIKISFDFRGRLLKAPNGNGCIAVARGPVVLSLDNRLVPAQSGQTVELDCSRFPYIDLKPNPQAAKKINAWIAFDAPCLITGQPGRLTLCDFASAGNEWREGNYYRTWLPQPLDLGKAYATGQTWQLLTHRPYRPVAPPTK